MEVLRATKCLAHRRCLVNTAAFCDVRKGNRPREGIHLGKGSQGFQPPGLGRIFRWLTKWARGDGLEVGNGAQARAIWHLDRARRRWCRAEASLGRAQLTFPRLLEWRQSKARRLRPGLKAP